VSKVKRDAQDPKACRALPVPKVFKVRRGTRVIRAMLVLLDRKGRWVLQVRKDHRVRPVLSALKVPRVTGAKRAMLVLPGRLGSEG
jgi:hypothetical protein